VLPAADEPELTEFLETWQLKVLQDPRKEMFT
jgi:hypothetical protein